ncbi:MAG: phosphate ABC transporter substrate-binding protein PstS family protein [Candidatus Thermoplasmatota archaeon]
MHFRTFALVAVSALALTTLAGCSSNQPPADGGASSTQTNDNDAAIFGTHTGGTLKSGEINQAGSSTVYPLAEAWAEEFGGERNLQIKVAGGGSGVGASKLCAKEIDLGDMSRTMKDAEKTTCRNNGVEPVEWKIAYDALSVVVSPGNTFAKDLTTAQLKSIFQGSGYAKKWNEVDPSFPAQDIHLCIPGADSGTYEYFREAILGSSSASHRQGDGVQANEDDNVLVTCIKADNYAIGYFGLAYVIENPGKVVAIKVNGVAPSEQSVNDKTYTPLSRFIFIYTNGVPKENVLGDYLAYVFAPTGGQALISDIGYVPLDSGTRSAMVAQLAA